MANPFAANDPAKLAAQRERQRARRGGGGGGGGGNNNNRNHNRNRNRNTNAAPPDPLQATTDFAKADPQAFFRGLLAQAGFDPNAAGGLADFWANQGATFAGDWNTYTTNPANVQKTIFDFAREQYGIPDAYLQTQNAQGGYVANPLDWESFRQRMLANVYAVSPQQRGMYDTGKQPGNTRYNLFS